MQTQQNGVNVDTPPVGQSAPPAQVDYSAIWGTKPPVEPTPQQELEADKRLTPVDRVGFCTFYAANTAFQEYVADRDRDLRLKDPKGGTLTGWDAHQELAYFLVWGTIGRLIKRHGNHPINRLALSSAITDLASNRKIQLNSATAAQIEEVLKALDSVTVEQMQRAEDVWLMRFYEKFVARRLLLREVSRHEALHMGVAVGDLNAALQAALPGSSKPDSFLATEQPPDTVFKPNPIGIDWWDDLTNGGMQDGDIMLGMAPTGGGKTVIATQVAVQRAKQHHHVAYFSYEQPTGEGDMLRRFLALMCGCSKNLVSQTNYADWSAELKQTYQAARADLRPYLHTHDMSAGQAGRGGAAEVRQAVERHQQDGQPIDFIIIDWIGSAALRQMSGQKGADLGVKTQLMNQFVQDLSTICRQNKCRGLILAQLDNKNQHTKSAELTGDKAADCKSMASYCQFVLGLGRLSLDGVGEMQMTKAREGRCGSQTVQLHGEFNEFRVLRGVVRDNKSNTYVAESAAGDPMRQQCAD